jgi:hypothetical protein
MGRQVRHEQMAVEPGERRRSIEPADVELGIVVRVLQGCFAPHARLDLRGPDAAAITRRLRVVLWRGVLHELVRRPQLTVRGREQGRHLARAAIVGREAGQAMPLRPQVRVRTGEFRGADHLPLDRHRPRPTQPGDQHGRDQGVGIDAQDLALPFARHGQPLPLRFQRQTPGTRADLAPLLDFQRHGIHDDQLARAVRGHDQRTVGSLEHLVGLAADLDPAQGRQGLGIQQAYAALVRIDDRQALAVVQQEDAGARLARRAIDRRGLAREQEQQYQQ